METRGELHVVIGAGQIGARLTERLVARGKRVRVVRRRPVATRKSQVEWAYGDITDRAFAAEATAGAAAVYHCANPPRYDGWDETLPPLARAVQEAAARARARLVVLDNLYMYGRPADGWLREDTPLAPCSRKGELRARLAEELFAAHARGDVRVTTGRASDFFGPGTERAMVFGTRFLERLSQGRAVEVVGDPDLPHAYSFVEDVAEGLAVLGEHERALGKVWHLPVAWNGSTRGLVERFGAGLGVEPKLRRVPAWLLRTAGLVAGELGAAAEMVYQWEVPYRVDDSRFREAFAAAATPVEEAVTSTLREADLLAHRAA